MENELRVSYSRNNQNIGPELHSPAWTPSEHRIDDLQLQIGPDPNTPTGSIENLSQLQENLTKTWGRHTIKAGFNISDIILSGFFVQRARGDYDYATLEEFLLDKQPSGGSLSGVSGERSVGTANGVPFGYLQMAAYVNDDFRVRPNLTLNLGLRYEYVTVPVGSRAQQLSSIADVPGVINFASPKSDRNNWAPRLGFAYTPGRNAIWSIRGGVSMSYNNTYINLAQNSSPAYYQTTVDVNSNQPVSNFLANGGLLGTAPAAANQADARASIASYTFDQHRPYALNGTIGVQHLIGRDYTIEARYVYTKGVHLYNQTRLNIVSPVTATRNLPTYLTAPSASQLAGNTLTLGDLQNTVVPGGTPDLPYNNLAAYGFEQALVGYHPWGNSRYNGLSCK
jgi:hypothetical protein